MRRGRRLSQMLDHRTTALTPAGVTACRLAAPRRDTRLPLCPRRLKPAHGKPAHAHLPLRPFINVTPCLRRRTAHLETAAGHHNHLRTRFTLPEQRKIRQGRRVNTDHRRARRGRRRARVQDLCLRGHYCACEPRGQKCRRRKRAARAGVRKQCEHRRPFKTAAVLAPGALCVAVFRAYFWQRGAAFPARECTRGGL